MRKTTIYHVTYSGWSEDALRFIVGLITSVTTFC